MKKKVFIAVLVVTSMLFISYSLLNTEPIFSIPIQDKILMENILSRISHEGIKTTVTAGGLIKVKNTGVAQKVRVMLIMENLIPNGMEPWVLFNQELLQNIDLKTNKKLQLKLNKILNEHIKKIDGVEDALTIILWTENSTNSLNVTASVIIASKPESDRTKNRRKIQGIEKIIKYAVKEITDDNIIITDRDGNIINEFITM
jgi:flagellar M-ring protein FliF